MVPQEKDLGQQTPEEEDKLEPHMRDPAKESQILLWLYHVLDEVSTQDYEVVIRDGTLLCRLMNKLRAGLVDEEELGIGQEQQENASGHNNMACRRRVVQALIRAMRRYGVPEQLLFCPEDLLLLTHVPKVTRSLFTLGKLAAADPNYRGPQLGQEPYNPVAKCGRRRGCLPLGDDIYVAHIDVQGITRSLVTGPKPTLKRRISVYDF